MSIVRKCPECLAALAANAPQGLCPRCLLAAAIHGEADAHATAEAPPSPSTIRYFGDYELLEEVARGGMGIVYRARQASLNRIVAVKMLLFGRFSSNEFVARFRTEAEAAASLRHPNIVAIHEIGEHEGQHYFSMDYVAGKNLAELVRDQPLPAQRAGYYVSAIARAVHYAHRQGVLHRDLKPSNVLIDENDQPHVTDFGLAKQLKANSELTVTGQLIGSPNYMPPEQADAKRGSVGVHSDVYALGAILYQLLTGRPPFVAETLEDTLRQLFHQEPVAPRLLNASIPRDLETICLKCLNKNPHQRYVSAAMLADDLDRWRDGKPILARPINALERFGRLCRRKPAMVSLVAGVVLLVLTVAIGSTVAAFRLEVSEKRARQSELKAKEKLWESYLAQARANRFSGRQGQRFDSLDALAKAAALRPSPELRNEAIACLALPDLRLWKRWDNTGLASGLSRFDRRLERYALGSPSGGITIHRVADDGTVLELPASGAPLKNISTFSASGNLLVTRHADRVTRVWDLVRREVRLTLPYLNGDGVDFDPKDRHIALTQSSNELAIFNADTGEKEHAFTLPSQPQHVRYDPTGTRLAVSGPRSEAQILDADTGQVLVVLHHARKVGRLAWHPDGVIVASIGNEGVVYVWDSRNGRLLRTLAGHQAEVNDVSFGAGGTVLFSAGFDALMLWDARTGERLLTLPGNVGYLQTSPDGETAGFYPWSSPALELYEFSSGKEARAFLQTPREDSRTDATPENETPANRSGFRAVNVRRDVTRQRMKGDFILDGRVVISAASGSAQLFSAADARLLATLPASPESFVSLAVTAGGLFLSGDDGLLFWPIRLTNAQCQIGPPRRIAAGQGWNNATVSADGRTVAAFHGSHCHVFDAATLKEKSRTTTQGGGPHFYLSLSPDGRMLATGAWQNRDVHVWSGETGELLRTLTDDSSHGDASCSPLFSSDGRRLIVSNGYGCNVWDANSWNRSSLPPDAAFYPSIMDSSVRGELLALYAPPGQIHLRHPKTWDLLAILEAPSPASPTWLQFSPDGSQLAVARLTAADVIVWDLRSIRAQLAKIGLDWNQPAFAPAAPPFDPIEIVVDTTPPRITENLERQPGKVFPTRAPETPPNLIDLSAHYNASLFQSWLDGRFTGSDLRTLPRGTQTLSGVSFDIRGLIQLAWAGAAGTNFPGEVKAIPVHQRGRKLHFLHAANENSTEAAELGTYVIHYANQETRTIPIVYGEDLRFWWYEVQKPTSARSADIAWSGANAYTQGRGVRMRLFHRLWENPLADVEIESIDFKSSLKKSAPFLVAITLEP